MTEMDDKIERLETLTDRLEMLEWEQLRQRATVALDGFLTYSTEAMLIVSPKGRILGLNQRAKELFGYTGDQLIKQSTETIVAADERVLHRACRDEYLHAADTRIVEVRGERSDGTVVPLSVILNPVVIEGQ